MNRKTIFPTRAPLTVAPAGQYFFPLKDTSSSTSASLANGTLRLAPFLTESVMRVDRIGADVATVGEAGSKFRIGVYADDGTGYPGALMLDAGTINGDSATVQEISLGTTLVLPPGVYWVGGAVQVVTTTQPTMRIAGNFGVPVPIRLGSTAPSGGTTAVGNTQTGVTGALPSTFSATVGTAGNVPRIHMRAA